MGRSKRRFETVAFGVESSSTRESAAPPPDQQSVEQSSEPSDNCEASTQRKKRGKTKMNDVWRVPMDRRIPIKLNTLGQPIGDNAQSLSSYVGIIVRSRCPFNYESWARVPAGTKNFIKNLIQAKFAYPPEMEDWLKKTLSDRYRGHKHEQKKVYFDPFKSAAENEKNCPPDMHPHHWSFLVEFFLSEKGKKLEEIGKNSRLNLKPSHTTGSKSYSRKGAELEIERQAPVDRITIYQASHIRNDGTYIDKNIPVVVENFNTKRALLSETLSAKEKELAEIGILDKVSGPRYNGRIRGVGAGPTRTKLYGRNASRMHTEVEFEDVKRQMAAQQDRIKELEEQMKREREEQNAQMRMMMQELRAMQQGQSHTRGRGHQRSYSSRSSHSSHSDANL